MDHGQRRHCVGSSPLRDYCAGASKTGELYLGVAAGLGQPLYDKIDVAITPAQKKVLQDAAIHTLDIRELAGEPTYGVRIKATGNGNPSADLT